MGSEPRDLRRRPGRVTAAEVAELAGVSRSAVSRTFTQGASVSQATRERVIEAAEMLGYRPNIMARSLMTQRTNLIAVVMGQLRNPFFTTMLERFEQRFRERELRTLLLTSSGAGDVGEAIDQALEYQVDAIVTAAAAPPRSTAKRCSDLSIPLVVINRAKAPAYTSQVWIDSPQVGRMVADLFFEEGRRRHAMIEGWRDGQLSDKAIGFRDRVEELGAGPVEIESGDFTYEGGVEAARRLLSRPDRPDAIFCTSDLMAFGALDVARQLLRIVVPRELSIVGFGDLVESAWLSHDLTTVRLPIEEIVDSAVQIVLDELAMPDRRARRLKLACALARRGTTLPTGQSGLRDRSGRVAVSQ
jgi:LacI family transcriptional regulator